MELKKSFETSSTKPSHTPRGNPKTKKYQSVTYLKVGDLGALKLTAGVTCIQSTPVMAHATPPS